MVYHNIFQLKKSYFLMLIVVSIVSIGMFSSCKRKSKVTPSTTEQFTLQITKIGTGSITASWNGVTATDAQLTAGIQIDKDAQVTLTATPSVAMPNVLWNDATTGNTYSVTMSQDQSIKVEFTATPIITHTLTLPSDGSLIAYTDAQHTQPVTDLTKIVEGFKIYLQVDGQHKIITDITGHDEGSLSVDKKTATVTMATDKTITATTKIVYALTLPADGLLKAYTDNTYGTEITNFTEIDADATIYLRVANLNQIITQIAINGTAATIGNDKQTATLNMTEDKTITATIVNAFALTLPTDGSLKAYTDNTYSTEITDLTKIAENTIVYLKVADVTKIITDITNATIVATDPQTATLTMTEDKTITATIVNAFALTLNITGGSLGAYTDDAHTIPLTNLSKIAAGTIVYLKVVDNNKVIVPATPGTPATNTMEVTIDANKTITATLDISPADFTYTNSSNQYTITKYTGSLTSVEFPATIDGYPVTVIGDAANQVVGTTVISVIISKNVKTIAGSAFQDLSNLISITIPNSVTNIGNLAFSRCSSLPSITIPSSVTSIGASAFARCNSLSSINIPSSVTSIGNDAFANCKILKTVRVEREQPLTTLGSDVFDATVTEIKVPSASVDAYKAATNWSDYAAIISGF